MRGLKWMRSASYLTDQDKSDILAVAHRCERTFPEEKIIAIRPPTYTGEPHPIAVVTYGPGERIFEFVYRRTNP